LYIIIIGAGEVGSYLAQILVEEQHDVAVIEANDKIARALESTLDALIVHGSAVSKDTLRSAGVHKADLLIAATQVDEVNLVSCMMAAKLNKNVRTVARVREAEYLAADSSLPTSELGLSMLVGPERAVASKVVDLLSYDGAGEIRYLCDQKLVLLELPLSEDSPLVHETLAELRDTFPSPSLVAGVLGDQGFKIPRGDTQLKADERAEILTKPENVDEFMILSGKPWHHVRHVLLVGCGTIGFHLARELEAQGLYPTIIEHDHER
jgi:trk system potassium uptake protein TrkA